MKERKTIGRSYNSAKSSEAAQYVADGVDTDTIAKNMFVSKRTVESYLWHSMITHNAISKAHLIAILLRKKKIK